MSNSKVIRTTLSMTESNLNAIRGRMRSVGINTLSHFLVQKALGIGSTANVGNTKIVCSSLSQQDMIDILCQSPSASTSVRIHSLREIENDKEGSRWEAMLTIQNPHGLLEILKGIEGKNGKISALECSV